MKRFTVFTIACMLIAITQMYSKEKTLKIKDVDPLIIEIYDDREGTESMYYLNDSVNRDWSTYGYAGAEAGISFFVSEYASEVVILKGDSAIIQGWPEHHFALQHSAYTVYQEKIFGFGGYGYWTSKNILRFWNSEKGWIPFLTSSKSPPLTPSHNSILVIKDSIALIIGGETTDKRNPFVRENLKMIQKVDLRTRMLDQIEIDFVLNQDLLLIQKDSLLIFKGAGELISIDLVNMKLNQTLLTEDLDLAIQNLHRDVKYEKYIIGHINSDSIVGPSNTSQWYFIPTGILFLIVVLIIYRKFYRPTQLQSRKISLQVDRIIYGTNSTSLTNDEIEILDYLMKNGDGNTHELNSRFSSDLSISHLNKLRSTAIKGINAKVKILSNNEIDEFICSRKARKDSRMVEYFIHSNFRM